jgi:hypothetical protein
MATDGRTASKPYRVKAGGIWYWVDPTVPAGAIEPGDIVIVYPVMGDAALAMLQGPLAPPTGEVALSNLEGESFSVPARDIAAVHLAAVDEQQ